MRKIRLTRFQQDESVMIYPANIIHTEQIMVVDKHKKKVPALNIWWFEY